jgi:hypothetical protein
MLRSTETASRMRELSLAGNVGPLGDVRADGQEGRVDSRPAHGLRHVVDLGVQLEHDAHVHDALHLGVQHVARQAVLGDAEAHHAAHQRAGFDDRHGVAQAAQVVGRRHARGPGADDQHVLAGFRRRAGEASNPAQGLVAQEPLDRVDAHRRVQLAAVAGAFAGVVADAAHDRREGIVRGQMPPGGFVVAALGVVQPALDVFARRALRVAGRQAVDVDRALGAPRAGLVGQATSRDRA